MFFYFQAPALDGEGRRHFWRYIDARTHEIKENRYEIAQTDLLPARRAPLHRRPGRVRASGQGDRHILAAEREAEAKAAAPTAVDPIQQTVTEEIKDAIRRRTVDREKAKTCISFLGQPMGRSLHAKLRDGYDLVGDAGRCRPGRGRRRRWPSSSARTARRRPTRSGSAGRTWN